jgi:hypothetical protein
MKSLLRNSSKSSAAPVVANSKSPRISTSEKFDPGSPKQNSDGSISSRSSIRSMSAFKSARDASISSSTDRRRSSSSKNETAERTLLQNQRISLLTTDDDDEKLDSTAPLLVIRQKKGRISSVHSLASIEEQPAAEKPMIVGMRRKSSQSSIGEASMGRISVEANTTAKDRKRSLPLIGSTSQHSTPMITRSTSKNSNVLPENSLNSAKGSLGSLASVKKGSQGSLVSVKSKESFEAQKARLSGILHQRRSSSIQDNGEHIPVAFRAFYRKRSEQDQKWPKSLVLMINIMKLGRRIKLLSIFLVKKKVETMKFQSVPVFDNLLELPWVTHVICIVNF